MVEPELAYMPWEKKEDKKGMLIVNLLTYSTYDIDNAKFISDLTMESYGAIVVVNSKNEIVYNTKMQKDQSVFVINMLPYGKYKIKVIRNRDDKIDNKWHNVVINQNGLSTNIILPRFPVSKSEVYIRKDEILPSFHTGNTDFLSAVGKGRVYCKVYEDNNLLIDEPLCNVSAFGGISEQYYNGGSVYKTPRYISQTHILEYANSVEVSDNYYSYSYSREPCYKKIVDNDSAVFVKRFYNSNGDEEKRIIEYTKAINSEGLSDSVIREYQACRIRFKDWGEYYSKIFHRDTKTDTFRNYREFAIRRDYSKEALYYYNNERDSCISIWSMFKSSNIQERDCADGRMEFDGDKFFFFNKIIVLIGHRTNEGQSELSYSIPYSEWLDIIYSKADYERVMHNITENKYRVMLSSDATPDSYEFLIIDKKTHYPYTEFLSRSTMYDCYKQYNKIPRIKSGTKIISNIISLDKICNSENSGFIILKNDDNSECVQYEFMACTNYSDDYDQY